MTMNIITGPILILDIIGRSEMNTIPLEQTSVMIQMNIPSHQIEAPQTLRLGKEGRIPIALQQANLKWVKRENKTVRNPGRKIKRKYEQKITQRKAAIILSGMKKNIT